ncbi:MAG: arsenite efflux transporter metallochaperone ArsD [Gallionellaceae bacterium]
MKKLEVFDPAMCCSTGVCGVNADPVLAQFSADLKWLEQQRIAVHRYNLSQDPEAFAANRAVVKEMEAGMDRLPILIVDGHIVTTGMYPSRKQLAQKLGLSEAEASAIPPEKSCCSPKSGCC